MTTKTKTNLFPIALWGKDHWSLLAYCETRAVDYKGLLDSKHLRINSTKRGFSNGAGSLSEGWNPEWATRLQDGKKPDSTHDDIDVLDGLEREGFLENIFTILNPIIIMTDKGRETCSKLRLHKMNGKMFNTFIYYK